MRSRRLTGGRAVAAAAALTAVLALAGSVLALSGGPASGGAASLPARLTAAGAAADPAALVNPFIGTGGHGNTFPGADTPFGMLQWSPDTTDPSDGGVFSASSTRITGFALTHMSGPGCRTASDVPVLPTVGAVRPDADDSFSHAAESAEAGYYSVKLGDGISVGLTATTRTGLAEFTFPAGRDGNLIFKLDGSQNGDSAVRFHRDSPTAVQGSVTSADFSCGPHTPYTLYFRMEFSRPAGQYGTFAGRAPADVRPGAGTLSLAVTRPGRLPGTVPAAAPEHGDQPAYHGALPAGTSATAELAGTDGAYVRFPPGAPVLAKVGISYVSASNAEANLAAEDPGWDFATTTTAAEQSWNALLGKIAITGGSAAQQTIFYTALYHALLAPSVFSDVNGQYVGADGKVHTIGTGQDAEYTNYSGWDIYRTQAQLEALLDPAAASGAGQSLLNAYSQTGKLPKWQAYGRETFVMVGDPADSIIADYDAFGATGFDTAGALSAMIRQATTPSEMRPGLAYLEHLGYLPENGHYGCCNFYGPVSTTLEYDTADFAISALAGQLGNAAAEQRFRARAYDWHNLLNSSSGLMQPRLADGRWSPDFAGTAETGFVEGDSWQYTGMVPFDVAGLAAAMGGRAAMARYLGTVLAGFRGGDSGTTADMANEPSIELPWEYDYIGRPYATQRTVRAIQTSLWRDAPGGIPGNDDLGAMSAWYVWSALGMYPMTPGTATLALGSPMFPSAAITLPGGGTLTITGAGASAGNPYVRAATWDGAAWTRAYVPPAAITAGGTLAFQLGSKPDRTWAAAAGDAPPSYGP
jgi:predicted alpha-1,2-mannosidase